MTTDSPVEPEPDATATVRAEPEPDATATVRVLHTGAVNVDRALAFRERTWHPAPYTGWFRPAAKRTWLPVSAYLIDHPDGPTLLDTGWHADVRTNQRAHLGVVASSMYAGRLPAGEAIHEQLATLGVDPADLRYVVLSHLHSDHVSGLEHVADAESILVSRTEWEARNDFGYRPSMWAGISVRTYDFEPSPYGPHGRGYDLYGDGSVVLVWTPGHSEGHVSVVAETAVGRVVLAGDVGYAARSWEQGICPGVTTDDAEMSRSLAWVRAFSASEECAGAFANHDPDVTPRVVG